MNEPALSRSELLEHIAATVRWLRSWGLTADEIREAVAVALDRPEAQGIARCVGN